MFLSFFMSIRRTKQVKIPPALESTLDNRYNRKEFQKRGVSYDIF
ncbi:hypothetical protein CUZ96_2143 [Enterococcus lactis]|nr:hypothetical protein [Enterococcus lactis]MBL5012477.1 hypothetical protein [Enterococcus lactis]